MFTKWFKAKPEPERVLYEAIVAAARRPKFYADLGVADSVDGRFDMITLHMFLVLERLRAAGPDYEETRQRLTDTFFADMDRSLREMGVGDLSVGKKVRKMAESFYGRVTAYQAAVLKGEQDLAAALARNVYAGIDAKSAPKLAALVFATRENLLKQDAQKIACGAVEF